MYRKLTLALCLVQFFSGCSSITLSKETKVVLVDAQARRVFFTATHDSILLSTGERLPVGSDGATGLELLADLRPGDSAEATVKAVEAFTLALAEAHTLLDELGNTRAAIEAARWAEADARLLAFAPQLGKYLASNSLSRMLNSATGNWFRRKSTETTESLAAALSLNPAASEDLRLRLTELAYASSASKRYGELDAFFGAMERVVSAALRGASAVAMTPPPEALRIEVVVAAPSDTAVAILPTANGTLSTSCKLPWRGRLRVNLIALVGGEEVSDPFILVAPGEYKIISFVTVFTDAADVPQNGINRRYKCINVEFTHSGGDAQRHRPKKVQVQILDNASRSELIDKWKALPPPPAAQRPQAPSTGHRQDSNIQPPAEKATDPADNLHSSPTPIPEAPPN